MSHYTRGVCLEHVAMDALHDAGWVVIRSAGSHGAADLVAVRAGVVAFVQCKIALGRLGSKEWNDVWAAAQTAGALALVAYRPSPRTMAFSRITGPRALMERASGLLEGWSP